MSALALIKRYTSKPIGIIVDRHAPPPSGKLTEDPQGEWMKWNDLAILYNKGILIEKTETLDELVADGHAQRALIRDITSLGYDDFEQVMKVLKDNREQVITERKFEIWQGGYSATGNDIKARLIYKVVAFSFNEACQKLRDSRVPYHDESWIYRGATDTWYLDGRTIYDNEKDARKFNG